VYRGGAWLLPFHRMVPPPRSPATDTHGCIMVGACQPYRIQGRGAIVAPVAWLRSKLGIIELPFSRWTGNAPRQGSRCRAPASRLRP
jgi:hypothetical protein